MKRPELTLWAALDAIEQLAEHVPYWEGTGDELVDLILKISGTTITPKRRAWLLEELSWGDGRRILYQRDVILEVVV